MFLASLQFLNPHILNDQYFARSFIHIYILHPSNVAKNSENYTEKTEKQIGGWFEIHN